VSFLESLIALVTSKAVAGTAAASLAIAGVAGIQTAQEHADERASELLTAEADEDDLDETATAEVELEAVELETEAEEAEEADDADVDDAEDAGVEEEDGDDQGRAAEVHAALTGDESIKPGSSEFGHAVAENAQAGKGGEFGRSVAAAASRGASERDDEGDDDTNEIEEAGERPEPAASGRPEGTPPSPEGDDSQDGLSRADDARGGERPGRG
jgi:hypothetical protein